MMTGSFFKLSRFNLKKITLYNYVFLMFCFLILLGNYHVDAKLTLYDKGDNEIDSLENFDLLLLKNSNKNNIYYYNDNVIIRGKIEFAQFIEKQDVDLSSTPCTLKPIPVGVALLVIPFGDNKGERTCDSFSDLILKNKWITQDLILPDNFQNGLPEGTTILPNGTYSIPPNKRTFSKKYEHFIDRNQIENKVLMRKRGESISGVPQVILFTSLNNGDPGIKEPFAIKRHLFEDFKVGVTLLPRKDMLYLESLASTIDHVSVTSDAGPWMGLIHSPNLLLWTINWGVTFGAIFVFTIYATICFFNSWGVVPKNPNTYILPGIAFSSLASLIILAVDPDNVRERFSLVGFALFSESNYLILNLLYVMLQHLWVRAAREITLFDSYLSPIVRISARIHRHVLYLNFLLVWATFIFRILEQTNSDLHKIIIPSIIWEIVFIALMNIGFLLFGIFMILALATDREVKQQIGQSLVFKFSNKADTEKAVKVFIIMMILVFSFSFLTISNTFVSLLSPTVLHFWKSRIAKDMSTSLSMILILFLLRSKSLSRYLINPSSSLLTTRPSSRSLVPTPEQTAEDEKRNSAAYTKRIVVVRPEKSYMRGTSLGMDDIVKASLPKVLTNNNNNNNTGAVGVEMNNNEHDNHGLLRVHNNNNNLFLKSEGNSKFDIIDL